MSLITRILSNKSYPPISHSHLSFHSQTVLITGSNTGLGAAAAEHFAQQGAARLILAVRNEQAGAKVQRIVQHLASDPDCRVEVWHLDLLDYDSICAFAKRCKEELERLDVAILNAGVYSASYRQSKYGWEETLQVNTLSTALLALFLLPKLQASKKKDHTPVLEFVSSGRHYATTLTDAEKHNAAVNVLFNFNSRDTFVSGRLYSGSKLLLMCFAKTLAAQLQPDSNESPSVNVISVCPGACQSGLSREMNSLPLQIARSCANLLFLRTAEEGSRIFISGTAQGEHAHGGFWQNDVVREPAPLLQGEQGRKLCEKVYAEIIEALRDDVPEVKEYLLAR